MPNRPIRGIVCVEAVGLLAAACVAVWLGTDANWELPLFAVLLVAAVIGDLTARDTAAARIKISTSFLAIITATVLLGATPGAVIGTVTILAGWLRFRYAPASLLNNLVTFAWFPLLTGAAFDAAVDASGVGD